STFERARLRAHLRVCPECASFRDSVASIVDALRSEPLVVPASAVQIPTRARRFHRVRVTAAAAAAVVAVPALGLASSISNAPDTRDPFAEPPTIVNIKNPEFVSQLKLHPQRSLVPVLRRPAAPQSRRPPGPQPT
ncbi:MAG: zf-HC2 domain-containing protein, partial [Actinomycetota bacterium]|nr:zf-HC2 domain-containing protein [Actinomycetota bacterium]